jgi:enamine deaminase RidA (YjgF/YER057c/UK114 family)
MTPEERLAGLGLVAAADRGARRAASAVLLREPARGQGRDLGPSQAGREGRIAGPFGQLGADLTTAEGAEAARDIALSVLANLKAEIGDLSRVTGWVRVFGMVNSAPGYSEQHLVMNGFSDLILQVFGPEVGRHARSAIGTAGLPMNFAMEVEAEVLIGA